MMIVVAVIAILAMIALPSFQRARQRAQNARFVNALRITRDAFDLYAAEHSGYPADANRGIPPPGMAEYFGPTLNFAAATPIGGNWDWDAEQFGVKAGISVVDPTAPAEQLAAIDALVDDGDLAAGIWRQTAATRYTAVVE